MHKTTVKKDFKEKSILVSREFNAPLETVWKAFTESELVEKWWAPKQKKWIFPMVVTGFMQWLVLKMKNIGGKCSLLL